MLGFHFPFFTPLLNVALAHHFLFCDKSFGKLAGSQLCLGMCTCTIENQMKTLNNVSLCAGETSTAKRCCKEHCHNAGEKNDKLSLHGKKKKIMTWEEIF